MFDEDGYILLTEKNIEKIKNKRCKNLPENIIEIPIYSSKYPEFLLQIPHPPLFIYCLGDTSLLYSKNKISIVGTRKINKLGFKNLKNMFDFLKNTDIVTVSGMALGVDRYVHEFSIYHNLKTIAVLGTGVDICYPKKNKDIYEKIKREGLIISEYPPGVQPQKFHFPNRNRIIAALSQTTVVVQSYKSGGSLITAEIAFENNRNVYAFSGNILDKSYEGNNKLIYAQKAQILIDFNDLLEGMEVKWQKEKNS